MFTVKLPPRGDRQLAVVFLGDCYRDAANKERIKQAVDDWCATQNNPLLADRRNVVFVETFTPGVDMIGNDSILGDIYEIGYTGEAQGWNSLVVVDDLTTRQLTRDFHWGDLKEVSAISLRVKENVIFSAAPKGSPDLLVRRGSLADCFESGCDQELGWELTGRYAFLPAWRNRTDGWPGVANRMITLKDPRALPFTNTRTTKTTLTELTCLMSNTIPPLPAEITRAIFVSSHKSDKVDRLVDLFEQMKGSTGNSFRIDRMHIPVVSLLPMNATEEKFAQNMLSAAFSRMMPKIIKDEYPNTAMPTPKLFFSKWRGPAPATRADMLHIWERYKIDTYWSVADRAMCLFLHQMPAGEIATSWARCRRGYPNVLMTGSFAEALEIWESHWNEGDREDVHGPTYAKSDQDGRVEFIWSPCDTLPPAPGFRVPTGLPPRKCMMMYALAEVETHKDLLRVIFSNFFKRGPRDTDNPALYLTRPEADSLSASNMYLQNTWLATKQCHGLFVDDYWGSHMFRAWILLDMARLPSVFMIDMESLRDGCILWATNVAIRVGRTVMVYTRIPAQDAFWAYHTMGTVKEAGKNAVEWAWSEGREVFGYDEKTGVSVPIREEDDRAGIQWMTMDV